MADLNELLVFARVVQAGSFTAAARLLGMPKSSVSKKVADLEERLGTRLLQRTTRKLGLTDAGRVYFERAAQIMADVDDADQAVAELQAKPRGLLRVTVPLSLGMLGPIVAEFLERHPDVQATVTCTDRTLDLVHEGIDVAVRAGVLQDSSLVAKRLGTIKRVLVAAPKYLKAHGAPRSPEELIKHACIAFGGDHNAAVWSLERAEKQRHIQIDPRFTVNDFEMMLDTARVGLGIAWVLAFVAREDLRSGRLKRVLGDWCSVETPVHAVYPTARHVSPKVTAFVEHVRERFSRLSSSPSSTKPTK